jgi:hypothetical protein
MNTPLGLEKKEPGVRLEGAVDLLTLRTETRPRVQPFGLERVVQKPFKLAATVALLCWRSVRGQIDEFSVPARQVRITNHSR